MRFWPDLKPAGLRGVVALAGLALVPLAAGAGSRPGMLDRTFAGTGVVRMHFETGSFNWPGAVVVQRDGKTVVGGEARSTNGGGGFALARYTPTGALDPTFDADGKARTRFAPTSNEAGRALAIQPDGRYVMAGVVAISGSGTLSDFALARYNSDGALDPTFDGDGKVVTNFAPSSVEFASDVRLQSDGKIVAAGSSRVSEGASSEFAVARYNADGSLDGSFSGDGKVTTSVPGGNDFGDALAIQPDGKIVVGGIRGALVRYLPDGSLDASFGSGGIVVEPSRMITDLALQADGKILATGPAPAFSVTRYNTNGSVDATFSKPGPRRGRLSSAFAVLVQPDGKIVAAGAFSLTDTSDFALTRFRPDGALDPTFGTAGNVTTDVGRPGDIGLDVALGPGGKVVVAGASMPVDESTSDIAIARYIGALPDCKVPNVRGKKLATGRASITRANCKVGKVTRKRSTRVKKGRVISQRPRARATLPNGGKVNLVLSKGRPR
jgi:uncharacterized delta-60 repeat protein